MRRSSGRRFTVAGARRSQPAVGRRARAPAARRSSGASCSSTTSIPRSPERGQYGFVQALVREVAYGTLARRDRRARHLAAARYFEALGDDELAGVLATHYLDGLSRVRRRARGGTRSPPRRGSPCARAAERAAALHSPEQASSSSRRSWCRRDPVDRADLLEQSGAAAQALNHSEVAERHLRDAIDLYRAVGDPSSVARTTAELGLLMVFTSRSGEAIGLLGEALAELADLAADENVVRLQSVLARALSSTRSRSERSSWPIPRSWRPNASTSPRRSPTP